MDDLRAEGGDTASVEVKTAAGGLPSAIDRSLCALANLPGGGIIILGLDERTGFGPAPIDAQVFELEGFEVLGAIKTTDGVLTVTGETTDPSMVASSYPCARSEPSLSTPLSASSVWVPDGSR